MPPDPRSPAARPPRVRLRVGFILARRFTLCAFANFVDVLRLAADEGDRSRPILCEWAVLSDTMEPVTSSCDVVVQPDTRLDRSPAFDYVVVIGGLINEIPNLDRGLVRFLQAASADCIPLVGVCTGAFILHRAGLMEGYRCCVNWFHHVDFLEQFDGLVPVSDRIFAIDRDRLTCSGGASSAHLAAALIEKCGISGLTFHDIRGTAVSRLALTGCSEAEIATLIGHALNDVRSILDAHYLDRDPALAIAAIRTLETRTAFPDRVPDRA